MRLRYEPADPYVVHAAFFPHSDEPVEWVLGRNLLADGLEGCAGHRDVRIWSAVGRGDQATYIALGSRAGTALLEVPVQDLKSFLESTEALVPRGTESGRIDWNTVLWISPALPGRTHDLTAARTHRIIRICERQGVPVLADRAYIGAGYWVATPIRRLSHQDLNPTPRTINRQQRERQSNEASRG